MSVGPPEQHASKNLADAGYERTWQQCKIKIKNLTQTYIISLFVAANYSQSLSNMIGEG